MTRVAINGFGRIGRNFLRAYLERRPNYEIVAINDLGDPKTMAHLLEFDSLLGRLPTEVVAGSETISVGGHRLRASSIPEPEDLPWEYLGVDVVVEVTGRFEKRDQAQAHLEAGAGTVVISAVANDADVTLVLGVNDSAYDPKRHRIISNASCTTNCVTPMAKVLHDAFRDRARVHDDRTCLHGDAARPRRAAQGSAARACGCDQPDSDDDRCHPSTRMWFCRSSRGRSTRSRSGRQSRSARSSISSSSSPDRQGATR
jgi:hypothetical protein